MKNAIALMPILLALVQPHASYAGTVKPGDVITPDNASVVADLVSPGNFELVKQGMRMKIVPTQRLEWPPPYKTATEKYSPQVRLNDKGELQNYVAGQPFPLLDPNDPQVATKVMWNFSFRPQYTDDADIRDVEIASYARQQIAVRTGRALHHRPLRLLQQHGPHRGSPIPTDPEATALASATASVRFRFWSRRRFAASDWSACAARTRTWTTMHGSTIRSRLEIARERGTRRTELSPDASNCLRGKCV